MRSHVAIVLAACLAVLGTGVLQQWHAEDHGGAATSGCASACDESPDRPAAPQNHDDQCNLCVQLHQPLVLEGHVPAIVGVTQWLGTAAPDPQAIIDHLHVARIDCRGPPAHRA